jgi:hypothetical protein
LPQCFFSLLSLEHAELFHVLDCEFNFQLDDSMWRKPWTDVFQSFHNCSGSPKIYHMNGGRETPDEDRMKTMEEKGGGEGGEERGEGSNLNKLEEKT